MKDMSKDAVAQGQVAKLLAMGYSLDDIAVVMRDITQNPDAITQVRALIAAGYQLTDIQNAVVSTAQTVAVQLAAAANKAKTP